MVNNKGEEKYEKKQIAKGRVASAKSATRKRPSIQESDIQTVAQEIFIGSLSLQIAVEQMVRDTLLI